MAILSEDEVRDALTDLPGWALEGGNIVRDLRFPDFRGSVTFVVAVAFEAEAADHHPDIDIRWNKVRLALSTHSEGGITPEGRRHGPRHLQPRPARGRVEGRPVPLISGIVGPVPEGHDAEEYDKLRRRVLWTLPYGLYIVGSRAGDRRNGMTLNWATQVSFDPKLVAISVEAQSVTHELITEGKSFTLNIVDREDRAIVRKFTKPVEVDADAHTLNGFPFHDGRTGAPVLDQAVGFVECEVRQSVALGGHTVFIGEVVDAGFQKPEDTPVLRMEDTRMNYGG